MAKVLTKALTNGYCDKVALLNSQVVAYLTISLKAYLW